MLFFRCRLFFLFYVLFLPGVELRAIQKMVAKACFQKLRPCAVLKPKRSQPGIEPGTTSTLKMYHTPRPLGRWLYWHEIKYKKIIFSSAFGVSERWISGGEQTRNSLQPPSACPERTRQKFQSHSGENG